jgi:hypothetical protein
MDGMQERIAVLSCKRDTIYSVPNAIRPAAAVTPPPVHLGLVASMRRVLPDQESDVIITYCSRMDSNQEVIDDECGRVRSSCFQFATDPG